MSKMSDVPKEVARLIVQATAPTHGPIVRFTCDIVTSNVDEDTGEVDLYARCDVSRLHEFADNSGAAPSGAFPHARLASMLLGGEDEQASVYFSCSRSVGSAAVASLPAGFSHAAETATVDE